MKICFKILIITIIILCLTTCKKYDEGGFLKQTNKNLFGANKVGSKKTWHLKLFEVNGIDSTGLIKGAYNLKTIDFILFNIEVSTTMQVNYSIYSLKTGISKLEKNFGTSLKDSNQCSNGICVRNIFAPELNPKGVSWSIVKLSKKEFIIKSNLINNYKIIMTSN